MAAYSQTVLKGQIASVAAAISAGAMDLATNTQGTTGFGNALAGQVESVAIVDNAGNISNAANVVES